LVATADLDVLEGTRPLLAMLQGDASQTARGTERSKAF
jgi:hypothetical protein